ncbi:hypothetical protein BC936DRAFT_144580 [Jimgerdemannia flammicorona]|uniref:Uncharacterized protein n=1 Tax=Jimgerdemannia flammicorona TaxID=994334 RepID=A0A433DM80_9FUNG|nr:hypothetical protein BC936DRAFT_144580 [Jimgerdemannia flammicorona]
MSTFSLTSVHQRDYQNPEGKRPQLPRSRHWHQRRGQLGRCHERHQCHDAIHKMNCQRIESNIRLVSRIDKSAGIQETMGKFQ